MSSTEIPTGRPLGCCRAQHSQTPDRSSCSERRSCPDEQTCSNRPAEGNHSQMALLEVPFGLTGRTRGGVSLGERGKVGLHGLISEDLPLDTTFSAVLVSYSRYDAE